MIAMTANPYYSLTGVRAGARIGPMTHKLRLGKVFRIGLNDWYVAPGVASNGLLKVRDGLIYEIGIANKQLTTGRAAQRRFLTSFSSG